MPQPPKTHNEFAVTDQVWSEGAIGWYRRDGPAYVVPVVPSMRPAVSTDMYWYDLNGRMSRSVCAGRIREDD